MAAKAAKKPIITEGSPEKTVIYGVALTEMVLASIAVINTVVIIGILFSNGIENSEQVQSQIVVFALALLSFVLAWRARRLDSRSWYFFYPLLLFKSIYFSGISAQLSTAIGCGFYVIYDSLVGVKTDFVLGGLFVFSTTPPAGFVQFGINMVPAIMFFAAAWARRRLKQ